MSIAAVPAYLGKDFSQAPPGHRFTLYFEAWRDDFTLDGNNKAQAIKQSLLVPPESAKALDSLRTRQLTQAEALDAEIFDAIATAPFATGLGMEHPLENGFAFLNPYGLPYLPGSGVKGVLRASARELTDGLFGGNAGWNHELIAELFGSDDPFRRGALTFWDVIPSLPGNTLRVDVMTPHQTHYYQNSATPHDSGQPNPIPFLTVPPGAEFRFIVTCEEKYLKDDALKGEGWKPLLQAAFEHAFEWLGFGAKTAVGYGAMQTNRKAMEARAEQRAAEKARADEADQLKSAVAGLPEDAAWVEEQRLKGTWKDNAALLDAVEGFLQGRNALSIEAFERLESELERTWPDITSNPDAVQGKKQKSKYKDRPKALAKALMALKP